MSSVQVERTFSLEDCPYETVVVDITHRCNMACANCYVPNRTIPDLDGQWLSSVFARLPRGRFIRLTGGEPTLRRDLPDLIRDVRRHGHHPILLTNGLRLANRAYVRTLKDAGLQIAYLSFSGGFDDDLYEAVDEMRCATQKRMAFENLRAEHIYTSVGMIVMRGVNEHEVGNVWPAVKRASNVREFHLRSVGAMGRHATTIPLELDEMLAVFCNAAGVHPSTIERHERTSTSHDFRFGRMRIQMTVWPDLGSSTRGRLTPEGMVAPAMEHIVANDGGY